MTTNDSQINTALAALQADLPRITKDQTAKVKSERTGTQYSYNYADLAHISAEIFPRMGKLGLSFVSRPTLVDGKFVLVYELRHTSGEFIAGMYPLPERGTPQETGGAITYARRYCLCAVTGVAPDSDDNDAALAEKAAKRSIRRDSQPATARDAAEARITSDQQRRLQDVFRELGMVDRDEKRKYAVDAVGRQVSSVAELSQMEAGRVIKQAERDIAARSGDRPPTAQPAEGESSDAA